MDWRWQPCALDSKRDFRVILHPTASIYEVRRGLDPASDDSVDLTEFVSAGSHTAFECNLTLKFNRELFGDTQPQPDQILEIQLKERGEWKPVWLGMIDALTGYNLQRGERSLQLVAKTRDQQDIWRKTKRVTPLFPQLTEFTYIAMRIARQAGLQGDEIIFPNSSYSTAHSNTQLADMTAWDMIESVFVPIGWKPFIDNLGRLRAADRGLQGRKADIVLEDERLVKVGGQRQRSPVSRVRVIWLNPILKKDIKQGQMLGSPITITLGWFIPYWKRTMYYSEDQTQRAENTYINWANSTSVNQFAKQWLGFDFVEEKWTEQAENKGKLSFKNWQSYVALSAFTAMIVMMKTKQDFVNTGQLLIATPPTPPGTDTVFATTAGFGVPGPVSGSIKLLPGKSTMTTSPAPKGSIAEAIATYTWALMAMTLGTGTYEIWGQPYDWIHARNVSEAFDSSVPIWVDNSVDVESDFIVNEEHAKAVAIRELVYQAREANKWSVTLVDDPRIEYGDILQFNDGSQLYVEDFRRNLERGSEATLDVSGFLIPVTKIVPGSGFVGTNSPPRVITQPPGGPPRIPVHLPTPQEVS